MRWIFLCAAVAAKLFGFESGNPALPSLMCRGVVHEGNNFALRIGYLDDYVYSQHMIGEFTVDSFVEKPPVAQFSTEAGVLTLNFQKRIDFYTILGSSRMRIDQEIFARRQFAWGLGTKIVIFQMNCFRVGVDFKYFTTNQKPIYLVSSGLPLTVTSNFDINYREYQAALGLAYQSGIICPYVQGTYLDSKMNPSQHFFLVKVPGFDEPVDASLRSFIGANSWGMAVGATLSIGGKGALNVESRFFNQNGIDASLEIRF